MRMMERGASRVARAAGPARIALPPAFAATVLLLIAWVGPAPAQSWELRVCADPNNMPFSRSDGSGFELRIAELVAEVLDADLTFQWWPYGPTMIAAQLREGACDVVMGVPDGHPGVLSTIAYYRSPFVFVYRPDRGRRVSSFDDPILRELRLGVHTTGGPPHQALLRRGLADNVVLQAEDDLALNRSDDDFQSRLVLAVAAGELDVAVQWGPAAGYFAKRQDDRLEVTPVRPEIEPPFTPMFLTMVMGVRRGDEALRDRLGIAIAARWDDIQRTLRDHGVPLQPLARPAITIEASR